MDSEGTRGIKSRLGAESALPYCTDEEVTVTLEWEMTERGSLSGRVLVEDTGTRACRIGGKPTITPDERAAAEVGWSGWCGEPASGQVRVKWQFAEGTVRVDGPIQRRCSREEHPTNT